MIALYANAAVLALILLAMLARGGSGHGPFDSVALGQQAPQPIAGGGGFFLMPAQFATNVWGCYVMDVDAQTLVAYRYDPVAGGTGQLRLAAARSFVWDRRLRDYNVGGLKPDEVRQLVEAEQNQALKPVAEAGATSRPTVPQ